MSRESHASTQDDSGESSEGIPTKIPPPIGMKDGEKFEEKRMPSLDQVTISPDDGLYYCPLSDCERPCRFETKTRLRCAYNIHSFWSMLSHPSPGTICDSGSSQLCVQSALTPQPCRKTCNVTLTAIMGALESLFAMNVKTSLLATITYWGIGEFNILCHKWIKTKWQEDTIKTVRHLLLVCLMLGKMQQSIGCKFEIWAMYGVNVGIWTCGHSSSYFLPIPSLNAEVTVHSSDVKLFLSAKAAH